MASYIAPLSRKSPLFFRLMALTHRPTYNRSCQARIPENVSVQIMGFKSSSSCSSHPFLLNSCSLSSSVGLTTKKFAMVKDLGLSEIEYRQFGVGHSSRIYAVADGGSAETTDGVGGSGGTISGGGGGRGDGGGAGEGGSGKSQWSFLSWYLALLQKHPVLTKAVTSALLTFVGDLICQVAIDQMPSLDLKRTLLFTLLGLVLVGPTLHFWYLYLSKLVTVPGASGAIMRLLLDQFVFSPLFIGFFLCALITLEGRPSQVIPKLQQEWFSSVVANWQLWIPFQFLNFRFVPQQFQVLAANCIAVIWNVILSYKAHKEVLPK